MPMWKKAVLCSLALIVLGAAPGAQTLSREPQFLARVAPATEAAFSAVADVGGMVVQELGSCLLAGVSGSALTRLQAQGLRCEVVGRPAPGRSYYLLYSEQRAPLLPRSGDTRCRALEDGVWLLQTGDPGFRGQLAQPFRLKALRLTPVFRQRREGRAPLVAEGEERSRPHGAGGLTIPALVAEVSRERLRADIQSLQDFKTRYASTSQCEAAGDFILRRFRQLGLDASAEPFTFETFYESRNILAVIPGRLAPKRLVLACAHYDSTSNKPLQSAPGADDNASGTAAILELARVLAGEKFDFSIVLLCVSAEEWGLYGSEYHARQARRQGADIIGVVNLDMVAYPSSARVLDVIGNRQSEWLANRFISAAQPYMTLRLQKVIDPSLSWSDHSSFWDQDYAALCGIEDSDNPYYHKTSDTLDTLDMSFALEAIQAALAAVADLAQPQATPRPPAGLEARSQVSAALFSARKSVFLKWRPNGEPLAGYHVYRSTASHQGYLRLTGQPIVATAFTDPLLLPDQTYYYVVSAVDVGGRESNYSEEVRDDENN